MSFIYLLLIFMVINLTLLSKASRVVRLFFFYAPVYFSIITENYGEAEVLLLLTVSLLHCFQLIRAEIFT